MKRLPYNYEIYKKNVDKDNQMVEDEQFVFYNYNFDSEI